MHTGWIRKPFGPSAGLVLTRASEMIFEFLQAVGQPEVLVQLGQVYVEHGIAGSFTDEELPERHDALAVSALVAQAVQSMVDSRQPGRPFDPVQPGKHAAAFKVAVLCARHLSESALRYEVIPDDDVLWAAKASRQQQELDRTEGTTWYPNQAHIEALLTQHMPAEQAWEVLNAAGERLVSFIEALRQEGVLAALISTHVRHRQHRAEPYVNPGRLSTAVFAIRKCVPRAQDGNPDLLRIARYTEDLAVLTAYARIYNELHYTPEDDVLQALASVRPPAS